MCDEEETDWSEYESGPFCRHWGEVWDCEIPCLRCGHKCDEHPPYEGCGHDGCACKKFEPEDDDR